MKQKNNIRKSFFDSIEYKNKFTKFFSKPYLFFKYFILKKSMPEEIYIQKMMDCEPTINIPTGRKVKIAISNFMS